MTKHPLYGRFSNMHQRCGNPRHPFYADYGGRGIFVVERWRVWRNFLADMGASFKPGLVLDRFDNDGPYSPENCRWATPKESTENRRNTLWLTHNGQRVRVSDVATIFGMRAQSVWERIQKYGSDTATWKARINYP